jgi:hypothetical protein
MPGGVGVYLVAFGSLKIRSCLEQSRAKSDGLCMRSARIIPMQVQMHLLGNDPTRPVGRNMVRRQLHADSPLSSGVDDAFDEASDRPAASVFVDGSIIEVLTSAGRVLTTRVYPVSPPPWRVEAPEGCEAWTLATPRWTSGPVP